MRNNLLRHTALLFILASLTFTAYSFMLTGEFKTMDDDASIVSNDMIKRFGDFKPLFQSSFFEHKSYYRPLVSLSFMLEYHAFGLNAFYYYLDNIFLHIVTSFLVYGLILVLLRRRIPAFLTALLFAIHPIQWEAVSNIPGRAILLCSLFFILGFLLYCLSRNDRSLKGIAFYLLSFVCFFLSLLAKESTVVLPLVLMVYEFLFVRNQAGGGSAPPGRCPSHLISEPCPVRPVTGSTPLFGRAWAKIFGLSAESWLMILPSVMLIFVYALMRMGYGITQLFYWPNASMAALGFLTFLRSVIVDFLLLLFPVNLQFDRSMPLFANFLDTRLIFTVLFYLILVVLFMRLRSRLKPEAGFFAAWFFIQLVPVSQLVVTIGVQPGYISTAEHFLYLPSIGFFALLVLGAEKIFEVNRRKPLVSPKVLSFAVALLFVFLTVMTVQQNIYSSQEISMFERTLELTPDNVRVRSSLARLYAKYERYDLAEEHYRKSLEYDPWNVRCRIGLGKSLCDQGKLWEGVMEYDKIRDAGEMHDLLKDNLEATYRVLMTRYQNLIEKNPNDSKLHYRLGMAYSRTGKYDEAVREFTQGIKLEPDLKIALFRLAETYEETGDLPRAAHYFNALLSGARAGISTKDQWDTAARKRLKEIYEKLSDRK